MVEMDCLFCKIVDGSIPASIVKQTEKVTAFNDISPQAPTHVLIIPNQHFENMGRVAEADPELAGEILKVTSAIAKNLGLESWRINANTGASAGQSVFHAHIHLMGGRTFAWPPG
jgi:histidine triad (HIT) family protein